EQGAGRVVVARVGIGGDVSVVGIDDRERFAVRRAAAGDFAIGGQGGVSAGEHDDGRAAARFACGGANGLLETIGERRIELGASGETANVDFRHGGSFSLQCAAA